MNNRWPYKSVGNERVTLDPKFWTPDGLYAQGYLEGSQGRYLDIREIKDNSDIPKEFIMGLEDGYGDWISNMRNGINMNPEEDEDDE